MTESVDVAAHYSIRKIYQEYREKLKPYALRLSKETYVYKNRKKMKTFIFVNEVAEPRSLEIEKYGSFRSLKMNNALPKHPFCKHMHEKSVDRKIEIDAEGRINSDEKLRGINLFDHYVAYSGLLKPRYLIKIESSGFDYEKYLSFEKYLTGK